MGLPLGNLVTIVAENPSDALRTPEVDASDRWRVRPEGASDIPDNPIVDHTVDVTVATGTATTVGTYTVTAGKTLYITGFACLNSTLAAGIEFFAWLDVGGTEVWRGRGPAGGDVQIHLSSPLKAAAGVVVSVKCAHFAGVDKLFTASINGYEV